ncbi:MAG: hypothetical protein COB53_03850 [Elusimicrobia bacterium]|nr:MAG: hypothetical protein COB53_03850 [Elusimicrobiota bacterium]
MILTAENLIKEFSTPRKVLRILDGVSFSVSAGESVAITGPSGSGKSSLLGLLAGLDRPTEGRVLFKGQALADMGEDGLSAWRRNCVGFVFQNFELVSSLTALENAALPLEILGTSTRDAAATAGNALETLGMSSRADHFPNELSGGEQQRVAIARAYVHQPEIIFADEPTGSLDEETAESVVKALLQVNEERKTALLLVTHNPDLAGRLDRVLTIHGGSVA